MADAPASPTTIDAYLAMLPSLRRERIAALRAAAHEAVPDLAESIEWRMPVFRRGDRWIAVASQKSYISVYLRSVDHATQIAAVDKRLGHGKGCVNIGDAAALPIDALAAAFRALLA